MNSVRAARAMKRATARCQTRAVNVLEEGHTVDYRVGSCERYGLELWAALMRCDGLRGCEVSQGFEGHMRDPRRGKMELG